jgi:TPR repeat protein
VSGLHQIANAYYSKGDEIEAFKHFKLACDLGCMNSQIPMAHMYLHGTGVSQNIPEATKVYARWAEDGAVTDDEFIELRDFFLERGQHAEALKWYQLAAAQGDASAQNNLGTFYSSGRGISQDAAEAMKWYQLAAAQGEANAQFNLGVMFSNGQGVEQDFAKALGWYWLAAAEGHAHAQFNLAVMYENGKGTQQDYGLAAKFYKLAAAQGDAVAQNNLGSMYGKGLGVAQDMVNAHMWTQLAAANGATLAAMNMGILAQHMTLEQISLSQTLARECLIRHFKACD